MNDIYTYTVPVFIKSLSGLSVILDKAVVHLAETQGNETDLLASALAPDMFPLVRQVQVASDNAKGAVARLTGVEAPVFEDIETTIKALQERIAQTVAFIQSVPESAFEGAHDRKIELPYFPGKYMIGEEYTRQFAIPNFFFHLVTAYGLIRKSGVPIGKADYTFGLPLQDL